MNSSELREMRRQAFKRGDTRLEMPVLLEQAITALEVAETALEELSRAHKRANREIVKRKIVGGTVR